MPKKNDNSIRRNEDMISRQFIQRGINKPQFLQKEINGYGRLTTPFRAAFNAGEYLNRPDYQCPGEAPAGYNYGARRYRPTMLAPKCDGKNVPSYGGNQRVTLPHADYIRFKKLSTMQKMYNE